MFDLIIFILSTCAQLFFGKKVCKLNPTKVSKLLKKNFIPNPYGHFVAFVVSFR